jgi:hypothetical protein
MPRDKLFIESAADRDATVQILARNKYTVRQGREKINGSSSYSHYVEYWRDEK